MNTRPTSQLLQQVFAFELRQHLKGLQLPLLREALQRAALVLEWPGLQAALPQLLQASEPEWEKRLQRWIPALESGNWPDLGTQPLVQKRPEKARPERGQDVRVTLQQLEGLFAHAGELTVLKNRLGEHLLQLQHLHPETERDLQKQQAEWVRLLRQDQFELHRISEELTQLVLEMRLRPASLLLTPLERLVRDLGQTQGKKVHFEIEGADTELDRNLLDPLKEALIHLLRNAMDHGLETPLERRKAGKPETGHLKLSLQSKGDTLSISLSDDGQGVSSSKVEQKAVQQGLIQAGTVLSEEEVFELLFRPGFSTAPEVSEISGRGVGLDAVRAHLEQLGGEIWLTSQSKQGTTFHLRLPQTLATTRAFVVQVAGQPFALPSRHIERILKPENLMVVDLQRSVNWQGTAIPVFDLSETLGLPEAPAPFTVVLNLADRMVGLNVEQVLNEDEFVIKPLPWGIPDHTPFQGVVLDHAGRLVPVLNVSHLSTHARPRARAPVAAPKALQHILVADDSLAVRTIQRSILEMAGFQVQIAENGRMALQVLKQGHFDLLLSDIEMPEMTGIELTRAIRQDPRLQHLPVVLITSMSSPQHREEGMLAGADAYLIKGNYAPEDLLDTIGRLI